MQQARLLRLAGAPASTPQGTHPSLERLELGWGGQLLTLTSAAALTCLRLRDTELPGCLSALTQLRSLVGARREVDEHSSATLRAHQPF